jgi:hypothetical protein
VAYIVAVAFAALGAFDLSSGHRVRAMGIFAFGAIFVILALRGRTSA